MTTGDPELEKIFQEEGAELLNRMEALLNAFTGGAEAVRELYRLAHTLKSDCRSVDRLEMAELALALEERFKAAREGTWEVGADSLPVLLKAVKSCQEMLSGGSTAPAAGLVQEIRAPR